ncbi:hypothetical protein [Marinomonas sp. 2405UD68-3]|uniref:hypothetical protein n=1 Tax=Marinomonas sp. 2405UD68-3 TaxID=3391835 RepID=UPI0039C936EA
MSGYVNGTWHPHWLMGRDGLMVTHGQSPLYRSGRICLAVFFTVLYQKTMIIWVCECVKKYALAMIPQHALLRLESNNSDFSLMYIIIDGI